MIIGLFLYRKFYDNMILRDCRLINLYWGVVHDRGRGGMTAVGVECY